MVGRAVLPSAIGATTDAAVARVARGGRQASNAAIAASVGTVLPTFVATAFGVPSTASGLSLIHI